MDERTHLSLLRPASRRPPSAEQMKHGGEDTPDVADASEQATHWAEMMQTSCNLPIFDDEVAGGSEIKFCFGLRLKILFLDF